MLGLIDAGLGRTEDALREGRRAVELLPVARDSINGALYDRIFRPDLRLDAARKISPCSNWRLRSENPGILSYGQLKLHPFWDALRSEPRFEKIIASLAPRITYAVDKSIAVLPFDNLSGDPENAFFADGIQDDMLTSLTKVSDLKVISRTSVMRYRGAAASRNLREIARRSASRMCWKAVCGAPVIASLVNVQLIDASNDRHIWAERYDRTIADSIGLQGELAAEIATALKAKLDSGRKGKSRNETDEQS